MINWGEEFYEHYEKFLKTAVDRKIYQSPDGNSSIQILVYEKVFKGCKVFASLGLTHYISDVKNVAEVVLVVDDGFEYCPTILANTLFYMINEQLPMTRGASVKGIRNINREFVDKYGKNVLYFTAPFAFPDEFQIVDSCFEKGKIFMACLISDDESGYLKEFGADRFESSLEQQCVDVFDIRRPSIV
jgi:hypothetical protein